MSLEFIGYQCSLCGAQYAPGEVTYLFGGVRVLQFRLQPLGISPNLLNMLPFLLTILVLWVSSGQAAKRRIGAPAALMTAYAREER